MGSNTCVTDYSNAVKANRSADKTNKTASDKKKFASKAEIESAAFTTHNKVLDTTHPVATFNMTGSCHNYPEADYFKDTFTADFSVDELNFDRTKISVNKLFRKPEVKEFTGGDQWACINPDKKYAFNPVKKTSDHKYEGEYKFRIKGTDKAGNTLLFKKSGSASENDKVDGVKMNFTSGLKILDITAPVYTSSVTSVKKAPDGSLNVDGTTAYYGSNNSTINAAFKVTERYFDKSRFGAETAGPAGTKKDNRYANVSPDWASVTTERGKGGKGYASYEKDSLTATYRRQVSKTGDNKAADGVYRFEIAGEDKAGNKLVKAKAEAQKSDYTMTNAHGKNNGQFWTCNKVLDTVAPKADLTIGDKDDSGFYKAEINEHGISPTNAWPYRKTTSASGTIVTSDKSPVRVDYPLDSTVNAHDQKSNTKTFDYEKVSFKVNGQQTFTMDITLMDRAGNVTKTATTNRVYLDVEPPKDVDELGPTIDIVAKANSNANGPEGNPLFKSTVPFRIHVTDPNDGHTGFYKSSGIALVSVEVLSDGDRVVTKDVYERDSKGISWDSGNYLDPKMTKKADLSKRSYKDADKDGDSNNNLKYEIHDTYDVDPNSNSRYNNNNLEIRVVAFDNSGNASKAYYKFGIDITRPEIRVTYDNNSAQNNKYFKENRTATIHVTERNFDPDKINITTQSNSQSGWSRNAGGGNGDKDEWTKTISYATDGDYTIAVSGRDLLGWEAEKITYEGTAPREFTIDKTVPKITITFDNNDNYNGSKYYPKPRTGTVNIDEHNFNSADAVIETTATIQRGDQPTVTNGSWGGGGDSHSISYDFTMDGNYTIKANYTDMAGNKAEEVVVDEFTIDQTKPVIEFDDTTVKNGQLYVGRIAPRLIFSDTNFDPDGLTYTLTGIKGSKDKQLVLSKVISDADGFGGTLSYENFKAIRANDDVYTAIATITDRAGNEEKAEIHFSVNRFGSTFDYNNDKNTEEIVKNYYTRNEQDMYLRELNVSKLKSYKAILSHGQDMRTLKEGEDYEVKAKKTAGGYEYVYRFFKELFTGQGKYSVTVQSLDEANNSNTNANIKGENGDSEVPLVFCVDKVNPSAIITGVDTSKTNFVQDSLDITVVPQDDIELARVEIYRNNVLERSYFNEDEDYVYGDGEFRLSDMYEDGEFRIPYTFHSDSSRQNFKVITVDAAGNKSGYDLQGNLIEDPSNREIVVWDPLITSNLFFQYVNTKPLFYGSIAGALGLLFLIVFLKRRKDKEEEKAA